MTRERWEVTALNPDNGEEADQITYASREQAMRRARSLRAAGWVPRVVHVRTYRVEVVYAWQSGGGLPHWWYRGDEDYWVTKAQRSIYADPLGKHSRKRAKDAALAAKPLGPCALVAIRRRVRE